MGILLLESRGNVAVESVQVEASLSQVLRRKFGFVARMESREESRARRGAPAARIEAAVASVGVVLFTVVALRVAAWMVVKFVYIVMKVLARY